MKQGETQFISSLFKWTGSICDSRQSHLADSDTCWRWKSVRHWCNASEESDSIMQILCKISLMLLPICRSTSGSLPNLSEIFMLVWGILSHEEKFTFCNYIYTCKCSDSPVIYTSCFLGLIPTVLDQIWQKKRIFCTSIAYFALENIGKNSDVNWLCLFSKLLYISTILTEVLVLYFSTLVDATLYFCKNKTIFEGQILCYTTFI